MNTSTAGDCPTSISRARAWPQQSCDREKLCQRSPIDSQMAPTLHVARAKCALNFQPNEQEENI